MGCVCAKSKKEKRIDAILMGAFYAGSVKTITERDLRVALDVKANNLGEFFTDRVHNEQFEEKDKRAKREVKRLLKDFLRKEEQGSLTKEELIRLALEKPQAREFFFQTLLYKGISSNVRWTVWSLVLSFNKDKFEDKAMTLKRKEIYQKLILAEDSVVVDIVQKDILRTNQNLQFFKERENPCSKQLFNICKALGIFFKGIGYVQGMNFIVAFLLQLSAFEEFETFNLIVNFWKKRKNLYFGIYEDEFILIDFYREFYLFGFRKLFPSQYKVIRKRETQNQIIFVKWIISFFTLILTPEFLVRVFDYLIMADFSGVVVVMISIVSQVFSLFQDANFIKFSEAISHPELFCQRLDYGQFNRDLKNIRFSREEKREALEEFNKGLEESKRRKFSFYYENYKKYLEGEDDDIEPDLQAVQNYSKDMDNTFLFAQRILPKTALQEQPFVGHHSTQNLQKFKFYFIRNSLQFPMKMFLSDIGPKPNIFEQEELPGSGSDEFSGSAQEISLNDELLFSHSQVKDVSGLQLLDQQSESVEFLTKKVKYLLQINQALQLQLKTDHRKRESLQNQSKKLVFQIEQLNNELQNKSFQLQEIEQNLARKFNLESHVEDEKVVGNENSEIQEAVPGSNQQRIADQNLRYKQRLGVLRFQHNQTEKQLEASLKENQELKVKLSQMQIQSINLQSQFEAENSSLKGRLKQLENDFSKKLDDIQQLQQFQEILNKKTNKRQLETPQEETDQEDLQDQRSSINQTLEFQNDEKDEMNDSLLSQNGYSQINEFQGRNKAPGGEAFQRYSQLLRSLQNITENQIIVDLHNQIGILQKELQLEKQKNGQIPLQNIQENSFKILFENLQQKYRYEKQQLNLEIERKNQMIFSIQNKYDLLIQELGDFEDTEEVL